MKTKCIRTLRIPAALLCLAVMAACSDSDEDHDGGSTAATPASTGGTMPAPAGGTATNNPPATTSLATPGQLASTQLVGTWTAPKDPARAMCNIASRCKPTAAPSTPPPPPPRCRSSAAHLRMVLSSGTPTEPGHWRGPAPRPPVAALEVKINGRTCRKP